MIHAVSSWFSISVVYVDITLLEIGDIIFFWEADRKFMGSLRYFTSSYLAGMSLHKEHKFSKLESKRQTGNMINFMITKAFSPCIQPQWQKQEKQKDFHRAQLVLKFVFEFWILKCLEFVWRSGSCYATTFICERLEPQVWYLSGSQSAYFWQHGNLDMEIEF